MACTRRQITEVRALRNSTPCALGSITVLYPAMMQFVHLVTGTVSETAASCKHDKRTFELRNQNESIYTWSNKLHCAASPASNPWHLCATISETALKRIDSACQVLLDLIGARRAETLVNSSVLRFGMNAGATNTDAVVFWGDHVI